MRKIKSFVFFVASCVLCYHAPAIPNSTLTLSLKEAILLAVRTNPNIEESQINFVTQKFALHVQQWEFQPHYQFNASAATSDIRVPGQPFTGGHRYNVQPGVSLLTPIGTQITLTGTNTSTSHYNPGISLEIQQPLIRGFGKAVVEAALYDACDDVTTARLNIEGLLRSTVSDVVNAYLNVVAAQGAVSIDEKALKRAEESVDQTRLFIKAGHKAGNELVTVEANVASARSNLENDKNNLIQSRYALLTAIGLDPNMDVNFTTLDLQGLIDRYHPRSLEETKTLVLKNDIQYQVDQIVLHGRTSRSLLTAKDNTRWQLNLDANAQTGNGNGGGFNAGINSMLNGMNQARSIGLTLSIPINDQQSEQAVVNAKAALQTAEIELKKEKWTKETGAINGWNSVQSASRALAFASDAEKLQEKTYHVSYQKYLHGLIDSLELQSAQLQLIQSQQTLLGAEINYIKALVNLDLLIGNTLNTWNVNVRL